MDPVHGPGKSGQHAGGKLGVAVQLQGEFHYMAGGVIGLAVAEYEASVRNAAVVCFEFFFGNKMNDGFVAYEIVGHGLDGRFNGSQVGPFFGNHEAFTQVHLVAGGIGAFTAADGFQIFFLGNGVLFAVLYAGNAADSIGMALAYALAPEGVGFAFRQHAVAQYAQQGEQARIPAYGNNGGSIVGFGYRFHVGKMFRNAGMGVEAVYRYKMLGQLRSLVDKIRGGTTAQDHNVDFIFIVQHVF